MNVTTTGRQSITTKFIPCTNTKPSRIKATCERGSIIVSYEHALNADENHINACKQLLAKFDTEDVEKWGQCMFSEGRWHGGATKTGYVFVQVP